MIEEELEQCQNEAKAELVENSIEVYPAHSVSVIPDHLNHKVAYMEPVDLFFEFKRYSYGSQKLRKMYHIDKDLKRYFSKRYFLFSLFDRGIQLDHESWYSVIPEPVSLYLLSTLQKSGVKSVFEPFSGVGGLAVHLCENFNPYWVNDIDPEKIKMLKNNVGVYGKGINHLKIINKDFFQIKPAVFDAVIVCPPWGGIDISAYAHQQLDSIMSPRLSDILMHAKKFSSNILLQMPKNTNIENLINVINMCFIAPLIKIDRIYINGKISQLIVWLGDPKFTNIDQRVFDQILKDAFQVDNALNIKQAKQDLRKKVSQERYQIFTHIYESSKPNRHLYFQP